ncbi:tRNA pseudouridine(55) synthase TruB [Brevibacterium daeguense]|uniref:tRNA pseudouridine synthase B n=1 Tax=Brevibacterium daeguense TaxID=909936 RepID=A0ABP8EM21_9MICO|nr:tRNA pseudouridine(55) synthase TruB [Brevibacterium daeguense]
MTTPTGILVIDKPTGLTSHDVVSRVRKWFGTKKVGHAGTLDPMATGVLVLGLGRGTKLLTYLVGLDKTYTATIRLGSSTPTDDADSEPDVFAAEDELREVTDAQIRSGIDALTGEIQQVPSSVSAIKVDGRRSYARVRAGEQVELKPRRVTIAEFTAGEIRRGAADIDVDVTVTCSSGTYVRALARDLGRSLGIQGHLTALRRLRVGPFDIGRSHRLAEDFAQDERPELITLAAAAAEVMPVVALDAAQRQAVMQGRFIEPEAVPPAPGGFWAGVSEDELIAVLERRESRLKAATGIAVNA